MATKKATKQLKKSKKLGATKPLTVVSSPGNSIPAGS